MKTLEELVDQWKLEEFGICHKCKKRLIHSDKFIDISEGVCGSSQGNPCAFIGKVKRYHVKCFKKKKK